MDTKKDIKDRVESGTEFIHLDKSVAVIYQCLFCGKKRTIRFNYKDATTGKLWKYIKYKAMVPCDVKIKCNKCQGVMLME